MSDWSKVTRPIPVPTEWTKPFWDAAKRGALELQRCQSCGHFQHPPYATCTRCVATDLKFEPVRGVGTIYAYTIMYHTGDKRFAPAVPYASIIVELDDAPGALLAGNLLEAEYTEAKVGRRVEVVFEKLNDDITLPQFRLATTNSAPSLAGTIGGGLTRRRALALVGGILAPAIPPNMSPAAQAENIRSAVAPTGKLRAAINIGNANLAAKEAQTGELRGVAVDLSRSFASRLGLPVVLVEYRNVGAIVDHARSGTWDIAFLAVDPARTAVDFSPSYMEVEAGYLVPAASSIQSAEDIDRIGVRIAVPARSAPDLFLSRTLKQATLVRRDTERAALEAFRGGEADVIATARSSFRVLNAAAPGYRELPGLLLAVPHSIAVPKGETEALAAVSAFVEQAKASGEVARAIADSNLIGLRVAPAASVK